MYNDFKKDMMYDCSKSGNTIQGFADQKSDESGEIHFVGTVFNPGMFPLNDETGWGKIFLLINQWSNNSEVACGLNQPDWWWK